MKVRQLCKKVLASKYNMRYEKEVNTHTLSYSQWLDLQEEPEKEELEKEKLEKEKLEREEFVIFKASCGTVGEQAEFLIDRAFREHPQAWLIYGDDDVLDDSGKRSCPYFKPDWSPDLLEECFYLGGLVAVRKQMFSHESWSGSEDTVVKPLDRAMIRRLLLENGGYERQDNRNKILHLPKVLFHYSQEAQRTAWMDYRPKQQSFEAPFVEKLSVVIPSKDNPLLLETCIESIFRVAGNLAWELIVVDNGSSCENQEKIEAYLDKIRKQRQEKVCRVLYVYEKQEFNFSRMCNLGAAKAAGTCLFFLNDDVELVESGCLKEMAQKAMRPITGAVGLKLLYPEGKVSGARIQHAGIVNLPMGPVHKLQFCEDGKDYYFGWNHRNHNALAVTAACLMVEKQKFRQAGGFDEGLKVAFNDVDLCYSLYEEGYENVCICDAYAFHDESYSRGNDEAEEKLKRLLEERKKLYCKHPALEGRDPYFAVQFSREGLDTRIRPAYEIAGNSLQRVEKSELIRIPAKERETWRQDPCLMVRVEAVNQNVITGWSVVLGDNNACYEKCLILIPTEEQAETALFFGMPVVGQYRPDLVENMPDQCRVGMSGFWVCTGEQAGLAGEYYIGILARNHVNGLKLYNRSNRTIRFDISRNEEA